MSDLDGANSENVNSHNQTFLFFPTMKQVIFTPGL